MILSALRAEAPAAVERAAVIVTLGMLAAAAWVALWLSSASGLLHLHHLSAAALVTAPVQFFFVVSWTIMTVAMMLPTSLPVIATLHTFAGERSDRLLLVALAVIGYLIVWIFFGALVLACYLPWQWLLASSPRLAQRIPAGAPLLLLLAGAFQFTSLKYKCLEKCRSPFSFVIEHWQGRRDRWQALRLGVDHGVFCVGCCWALMLLMFAVGAGSLVWMLILALLMAVEKNVRWGRRLSAPVGAALLAWGTVSLLVAQDVPRPRILGVAHIAVFAKDYEKSKAFYRDFLGFEEPYSLAKPDGTPAMTFFKINERQYIELFPETAPDTDRLNHISIETDNAEAMRRYLASLGVAVPNAVPKGRIGNSNFNVKDPDGHTVEIVQYEQEGWTVRERGKHIPDGRVSKHMMHVGIIVTALEPAMKFYRDILGFSEIWRGSSSGTALSWVNLKVPDGEDYIEFMLYKDAPAPERRGTAHHLALEVSDAAASVAALEAKPYRKQYTRTIEVRTGVNRKRQVNLYDPDGTRTELMEPVTVDGKPAPSSQAPPPQ